jgi:hypothetical protein
VENPQQTEEIKIQVKQTKLEKYGDENYNNKEKSKETCLEKYNVEHIFQVEEFKDKAKQTRLEKYGDENYNNRDKAEQTYLEKYGNGGYRNFEKCCKTKEERYDDKFYRNSEKIQNTNLERYDHISPFGNKNIQEKVKITNIKRYNCNYPFESPEIQQKIPMAIFKKYGVTHPMHIPEVADKCLGWHKNSWHDYELPSGKIIKLQGYEPRALDLLLTEYTEEEIFYKRSDMPSLFYDDKGKLRKYYPDFYIPKDNLIIEVKSTYTYKANLERNLLKEQCAKDAGFEYKLMI